MHHLTIFTDVWLKDFNGAAKLLYDTAHKEKTRSMSEKKAGFIIQSGNTRFSLSQRENSLKSRGGKVKRKKKLCS